jgi:hypothetical protein
MDDILLSATAKHMHLTGEVAMADYGREINGQFTPLVVTMDKRPWLYPFGVSLLHDLLGYAPSHAFLMNAALAVLFLFVVFCIGRELAGVWGGGLSVALWASLPLLQQNAAGGGMEMLNLVLLHCLILFSMRYVKRPSAAGQAVICYLGVLLTYARYESGVFLGAVVLVVVLTWWRERQFRLTWAAVFAPPLLLAALLQLRIYGATEASWELAAATEAPFALAHLQANWAAMFRFFWHTDPAIANSLLLGIVAIPAVLGFPALALRARGRGYFQAAPVQAWGVFWVFLGLNLLIILCFHAAEFDRRYVARYSLPAHAWIIFSGVAGLAVLGAGKKLWAGLLLIALAFVVLVTWPRNQAALFTKANFALDEQRWLEGFEARVMGPGDLVIDRFNMAWTLRERPALGPAVALLHADRLAEELRSGKWRRIYLVMRESPGDPSWQVTVPAVEQLRDLFPHRLRARESFRDDQRSSIFELLTPEMDHSERETAPN